MPLSTPREGPRIGPYTGAPTMPQPQPRIRVARRIGLAAPPLQRGDLPRSARGQNLSRVYLRDHYFTFVGPVSFP